MARLTSNTHADSASPRRVGRPRRVLLAEDDNALSRVLADRLRSIGAHVTVTHDASHALFIMMQNERPDLVILDIRMPSGNGLAVCEMMRDDARLATVPVIILSGVATSEHISRAKRLKASFVRKDKNIWAVLLPLCERILFGAEGE